MKNTAQTTLLGMATLLALLWLAPAALADSSDLCGSTDEAADNLREELADLDVSDATDKQCSQVCHEVRKACEDLAHNRHGCEKDVVKRDRRLEEKICDIFEEDKDAAKACAKSAKDSEKASQDDLKADKNDQKKTACRDLEDDCLDDCPGTLFPSG